ncbi:MAG: hypothetical protein J7639_07105 [Paenibacillaceae bacterium]|nr:hypothetical protein [Paenibacillaceae bacterium]
MAMAAEKHTEFRDDALRVYAAALRGDEAAARATSARMEQRLRQLGDEADVLSCAWWLWALGETQAAHEEAGELVSACAGKIAAGWKEPAPHALLPGDEAAGVGLVNAALSFAALRTAAARWDSAPARQACKLIREAAFARFMRGDHFVSDCDGVAVRPDIVAAAVPFGLISAGDLALLAAIRPIDDERLTGDTAALWSWYCGENGQPARARRLLAQTAAGAEAAGDDSPLFDIAALRLVLRAGGAALGGVRFRHEPLGGECPYIFGRNERSPRVVKVGDAVTVSVYSEPFDPAMAVAVEFAADGREPRRLAMTAASEPDGEAYWTAALPTLDECVGVRYRFVAEAEEGEMTAESEWFGYDVLQWVAVGRVAGVVSSGERVAVRCAVELPGGAGGTCELTVAAGSADSARLSVALLPQEPSSPAAISPTASRVGCVEASVAGEAAALRLLGEAGAELSRGFAGLAGLEGEPPLLELLTGRDGRARKLRLNWRIGEREMLYGMGERFGGVNHRGQELDNYVFNQYKEQGNRTYMPVPAAFSSGGYGLLLDSSLYAVFRFGTLRPDLLQIEADLPPDRQSLDFRLMTGRPLAMTALLAEATGLPKLPPKWAFGPWMSSNNWDSEREIDWQLAQTAEHAIPSTVMVIEQWSDEASFYIFNDAEYAVKAGEERFAYGDFTFPAWGRWPDPQRLVRRIHDAGIKVLLWQAPVMKFMDGIAHRQRDEDERAMLAAGYAVKNGDGSAYRIPPYEWFRGSLVPDFTNPAAVEWWLGKRRYLLDEIGIDGFKTDGGECIYGSQTAFHDGRSGAEMRNEYPNVYIGAFHEYALRHKGGDAITFSRAGYAGAQATPLHWAGDERSTFAAFRASIVAGLNSGLSGIPFWGWDLGGFSGEIPTAELYIRSAQMAAFCPVMQYHAESKGQFNMDRTPWNIAERTGRADVLALYKRYADIRMNLLPYIYREARHSSLTGHPLMRAMLLDYPDDPACGALTEQYMFGSRLLVAPVTEEGAERKDVYLPAGNWLPLFGGRPIAGGQTQCIEAPLAHIPVFVREDSVIPLQLGPACELGDDVGNRMDGPLTLMIYACGGHVAYEDDEEEGRSVRLTVQRENGAITAKLEAALPAGEPIALLFRAIGDAASVEANAAPLKRAEVAAPQESGVWLQRGADVLVKLERGGTFDVRIDLVSSL